MHRSTASQLRLLDNRQLEARCHAEHCDLTSTDAETVLLERLGVLLAHPLVEVDPQSIEAAFDEVACQFPDEDFLEDAMESLRGVCADLRDSRSQVAKDAISHIQETIETLNNIQSATTHAAEYARLEIKSVTKTLQGA